MIASNPDYDMAVIRIKEWLEMSHFMKTVFPDLQDYPERWDLANAGVEMAYNRAKEALQHYVDERTKHFEDHERILETIEETLKEKVKEII